MKKFRFLLLYQNLGVEIEFYFYFLAKIIALNMLEKLLIGSATLGFLGKPTRKHISDNVKKNVYLRLMKMMKHNDVEFKQQSLLGKHNLCSKVFIAV